MDESVGRCSVEVRDMSREHAWWPPVTASTSIFDAEVRDMSRVEGGSGVLTVARRAR